MVKKQYPVQTHEDFYQVATADTVQQLNEASQEFGGVYHAESSRYFDYSNLTPNISSRPALTRHDYEAFRPDERVPQKHREIMCSVQRMYEHNGLIKDIIDLMGDFAKKGIRVSCANKRDEKFYRAWWKKVEADDRSERFLNCLYRLANVIIRRQTASISLKQRAQFFRSIGKPDIKVEQTKVTKAEIPWKYIFLNPASVDVIGGPLAVFANKKQYVITFPPSLKFKMENLATIPVDEQKLLTGLPKDMVDAIQKGGTYLLPADKTLVFHYKKDDWCPWAKPMTYSIFDDVVLLEKLKLSDIAATDGARHKIRIFRLGSLNPLVLPAAGQAAKLKEILGAHTGGGPIDIVWGPGIDIVESNSDLAAFLGIAKYEPVLNSIYGGMGIPQTLTGQGGASGTTNNLISLNTLIERLEYGRRILLQFWMGELEIVRQAMGLEQAFIEFDYMEMGDPAAEKKLLVDLSDRGLISDELLQEKFKNNSILEDARISAENKERDDGTRPQKAGLFYDPQMDQKAANDIKQGAIQTGYLTPQHVGISPQQLGKQVQNMNKVKKMQDKQKGVQGKGRPKNAKDGVKRKQKRFVPRTKASLELWLGDAQAKITEIINPALLHSFDKKNMRGLSAKETEIAEKIKFGVLFNLEPFDELNEANIIGASQVAISPDLYSVYENLCESASGDLERPLTYDDVRKIQVHLYREIYGSSSEL